MAMLHLIANYEHLPVHVADIVRAIAIQHRCPRILADVLRYATSIAM